MPIFYKSLTPELTEWALKQSVFWTASAPLVGKHVNISPKGLPGTCFSIFDPNKAAYIDFTGSGSETISHMYENGRITILFNSFGPSPRILRLFCSGRVVEAEGPTKGEFDSLIVQMGKDAFQIEGARAIIMLNIWEVQTSCGFGVPIVTENGGFKDRETLRNWVSKQVQKGEMPAYQAQWNYDSLDGLTGLRAARRARGEKWLWIGDLRAWVRRIVGMREAVGVGFLGGVALGLALARGIAGQNLSRRWW